METVALYSPLVLVVTSATDRWYQGWSISLITTVTPAIPAPESLSVTVPLIVAEWASCETNRQNAPISGDRKEKWCGDLDFFGMWRLPGCFLLS